ncbi:MAG: GNAT family protein [Planctomycetota bacterium]|nr:GNAT family protein [Planctomycetota bacterium]
MSTSPPSARHPTDPLTWIPRTLTLSHPTHSSYHLIPLNIATHTLPLTTAAAEDPHTFRYFSRQPHIDNPPQSPPTARATDSMRAYLQQLSDDPKLTPFTILHAPTQTPVGVTTFLDINPTHRNLEIGWTWYARSHRGTLLNPLAKLLLLAHAFESAAAIRVQLKTDERNAHSRAAILKLGARFEGLLRDVIIMPDGHRRTTAFYSILDHEWPAVRANLETRLRAFTTR